MIDFVSFPLFGFTLLIKLRNSLKYFNFFYQKKKNDARFEYVLLNSVWFGLKSDSHLPKKYFLTCFNDSPSKMMKNAFYFI